MAIGVLIGAPSAGAAGGSFPSNAPTLAPRTTVTGGDDSVDTGAICCSGWQEAGHAGVQYWRIKLTFGDRLKIDFENVTGSGTGLCVLSASVTDFTVADADCLALQTTPDTERAELVYTAAKNAKYLLAIFDNSCCNVESWAYSMKAYVRHRSELTLAGPAHAARGTRISLHGKFTPPGAHDVYVQRRSSGGWHTVGKTTSSSAGAFSLSYRVTIPGANVFRAVYKGSSRYLPSSSPRFTVNVGT